MPIESIQWGKGRQDAFISFIDAEIQDALGPHDMLVRQWIAWLEQYRAPAKRPLKSFPYEGAANFELPMTATDVDQLFAKFIQTIHAAENVWTLQPLNEKWIEANKPLQDFLTWLDGSTLHMLEVNLKAFAEMVKFGTAIYKTGWLYEKRPVWTYDDRGNVVKAEKVTGHPFVDHVRLADFLLPATAHDVDPDVQNGASWVAERLRPSVSQLRSMAQSSAPYLPNISKDDLEFIIRFEEAGRTPYDDAVQQQDYEKRATMSSAGLNWDTEKGPSSVGPSQPATNRQVREIELWEVHARFPTKNGDSEDDIIVWYHKPTRRIVRGVYQYYHHGKRPYDVIRYFPGEGFYGIGVCEQTEMFQQAGSDLFNFTWDNVVLSNSRGIVAKSGGNIVPGEAVYPWKIWITDGDVRQDFTSFAMADIYQSLPMLSGDLRAQKDRRNGVGDIQLGQIDSLPGRTPATTMMSLLQEGNRRPDLTVKMMRSGLSAVGLKILQVCQQFMATPGQPDVGGKALLQLTTDMLGMPEGQAAAEKLGLPAENVSAGIGVALTATSGSANKEVEKQNYLALLQLAQQITQAILQYTQIAMQAQGTPLGEVAEQAIGSLMELGKRTLETYDIRNIEQIIPSPAPGGNRAAQTPAPVLSPGTVGGPGSTAPGAQIDPRMAALLGGVG